MSELPWWVEGREAVVAAADPSEFRGEPPQYHLSREHMSAERTFQFAPDSLEAIVERVVQVFEVEVTHKHDPATWASVVTEHFRTNVNGGTWATPADIVSTGSYNLFIGDNIFYPAGETFDSSHDVFHNALPDGFFWEVLEVLSGPPNVTFKWRHWGRFTGEYMGVAAHRRDGRDVRHDPRQGRRRSAPAPGRALLRLEPTAEQAGRRLPGRQELSAVPRAPEVVRSR